MSDKQINKNHPDVIIDGQPYEVVSKVTDEHGVVWVNVEPTRARALRIRQCVRQEALRISRIFPQDD